MGGDQIDSGKISSEILKLASAYLAQAELDLHRKR